jgi:nitroreductase/NAD-dependent dihydropyrimidine dehydrogenase PreA subunit
LEIIEINSEKCTNCGICYDVCPSIVFDIRSTNGHKEVFVRYPEFCSSCGHCMAACKPLAIIHPEFSYDEFEELNEIDITPASMKNLLFSRRSVRKYKEDAVPKNYIDELIEVATHAGTGSNLQSVGFLVVEDKGLLQKLEFTITDIVRKLLKLLEFEALLPIIRKIYGPEMTDLLLAYYDGFKLMQVDNRFEGKLFRDAPALILAHDIKKNPMGSINCAIAMRNIETLALTMGLGTCWNGLLVLVANKKAKAINSLLDLDSSRRIWGALMIGYPRYRSKVKIPRQEREVTRF